MGREVTLSARMGALTQLLTPGYVTCDVGCDHGFVSIYLVQQKIAPKVYAMDVRSGPLSRAREHIALYGLEEQIQTRLSDGLQALSAEEAQAMICAGMGGKLMMKILTEGREKAALMRELILQPQSELKLFRSFLREQGFVIVQEDMVYEEGKYYPMMRVIPQKYYDGRAAEAASVKEQELWDAFGPMLLKEQHPILLQYLNYSEETLAQLLAELRARGAGGPVMRIRELEGELEMVRAAKRHFR